MPPVSRRAILSRRAVLGGVLARPGAATAGTRLEPRMTLVGAPPGAPGVALTLDACPGGFDARIVSVLTAARIPATIFVTGRWMRMNPEGLAILRAHADLFSLQNHGEWHIPPVLERGTIFGIPCAGDLDTVRREVERGARDIQATTGAAPTWYRAATGFYSPPALEAVRRMGFRIAGYSLNGDQGASLPAHSVARRIAAAPAGSVIVAHVNQPHRGSGQGVADGVLALQARGVRFARLDRLGEGDVAYG